MKYPCCTLLLLAGLAYAATPGPRHTDPLHGFSIQPPEEARQVRRPGAVELVQFVLPDPEGGDIPIQISVLAGSQTGEVEADLSVYAEALKAHLLATQNFEADPALTETTVVAGRPALVLAGPVGGAMFGVYRRDVWVQFKPGRFLVVRTSGAPATKQHVIDLSQASVDTLQLFDAEEVRAKLEQDLAQGAALLNETTPTTIRRALARREYWLAMVADGGMVGFVHVTEAPVRADGADGVRVVTETARSGPATRKTLTRDRAFAAYDRSVERWELLTVELEDGEERSRHREFGLQQDGLLVVQTVMGAHQTQSRTLDVPSGIYLPRTLGTLAPRLINTDKPGRWAFAQYDPAAREIVMRTLTVKGPRTVTLGGQTFHGVELTDRVGLGAPEVPLLVGGDGLPLRIALPDGAALQQTTEAAIRRHFQDELDMLRPATP